MATTLVNPLYPRPWMKAGTSTNGSGFMLTVSSSSAATSFTLSNFNSDSTLPTELFFFDIQNANVLVTFDGTTGAQFTHGHNFAAGTNYTWQGATLLSANFTLASGTTTGYIYASQFAV